MWWRKDPKTDFEVLQRDTRRGQLLEEDPMRPTYTEGEFKDLRSEADKIREILSESLYILIVCGLLWFVFFSVLPEKWAGGNPSTTEVQVIVTPPENYLVRHDEVIDQFPVLVMGTRGYLWLIPSRYSGTRYEVRPSKEGSTQAFGRPHWLIEEHNVLTQEQFYEALTQLQGHEDLTLHFHQPFLTRELNPIPDMIQGRVMTRNGQVFWDGELVPERLDLFIGTWEQQLLDQPLEIPNH